MGHINLLQQLKDGVNKRDKKRGKLHEVWQIVLIGRDVAVMLLPGKN